LAGLLYRPKIHTAENVEYELEEIVENDDRIIFASNHLTIADQFPIAALTKRVDPLRPLGDRVFALAKSSYFTKPYLKPGLDATGTLPVFRPQDVDSNLRLQAAATRSLIQTSVARIVEGWSMLIFPEGTRNREDPGRLGTIHGGIGRIASEASKEVGVSIVPVALWYGPDDEHHFLHPDIYIGHPIPGPFRTIREPVDQLKPALEDSLGRVIELSHA
jgi:1-acyl-sn-glycerol-3-phosphate acyltransferase